MADEIAWQTKPEPGWAKAVARIRPRPRVYDGNTVTAWEYAGECPRCGHDGISEVVQPTVLYKLMTLGSAEDLTTSRWVRCKCSEQHAGRPPDKKGCGQAADVDWLYQP